MARALAFHLSCGTPLALGLGLGLGLGLQALHSRLDGGQAVFSSRQLGGQLITPATAQGRVVFGILLVGLCHQRLYLFAQLLDFFLHIPVAHGFVPRRSALDFGPIGRYIAQLHQPRLGRDTEHRNEHVAKGLQMQLAKITDRAKVRPILAHNGNERQVTLAHAWAILRLENTPTQ